MSDKKVNGGNSWLLDMFLYNFTNKRMECYEQKERRWKDEGGMGKLRCFDMYVWDKKSDIFSENEWCGAMYRKESGGWQGV